MVGVGATGIVTARLSPDKPDYREAIVAAHQPMGLDPLLSGGDPAVRDVARLLYPALLRLDATALPVTDLAAGWGGTGDGLSYRFSLPVGREWSDGSPLTAADIVATIALVQASDYPDAPFAANWQGVVARAANGSVTFDLPSARASFPVTVSRLPILPAAKLAHRSTADVISGVASPMPTSGPYSIVSAESSVVRLTANRHSPVTPRLTNIELRPVSTFSQALQLFEQGEVDAVEATSPEQRAQLAHLDHTHLHDTLTFEYADLVFNERTPGLEDAAVRKAIATTINRHLLITGPLADAAQPQIAALPAGILWVQPPAAPLDAPTPALAERALDAAGWLAGGDGIRRKGNRALEFTLSVPAMAPLPAVADNVTDQLRVVGIALDVARVPTDQFTGKVIAAQGFQIALVDWQTDGDPDITSFWRSTAVPPQGFNVSGAPTDAFLDQAIDSLSTLADPQLRRAAGAQVDGQLTDDVPAVFLYAPTVTFATHDNFAAVPVPVTGGSGARYDEMTGWPPPGT